MSQIQEFQVLVGTRNPGKVREIQEALVDVPLTLLSLKDFPGMPEVEEGGKTYQENSILKAMTYSRLAKLSTLADDSGLEVDALGGGPGPLSARFGGTAASDADRVQKLLRALEQQPSQARSARFVCCLTLAGWERDGPVDGTNPSVLNVVRGELEGSIALEPSGTNGFGYDPVFVPTGLRKTLGDLPSTVKNRISHRAKALAQMREFLIGRIRQT